MRNSFSVENGTEGSKHDLWSYSEIYFKNLKGEEVMLHVGLQEFLVMPSGKKYFGYGEHDLDKLFCIFVGLEKKVVDRLVSIEQQKYYDDYAMLLEMGYQE